MKKLLALLLALLLAVPSGFALTESASTGDEEGSGFWGKFGDSLNDLLNSAQEKAKDAVKIVSEKAADLADEAQDILEDLPEKAQDILKNVEEKVNTGKEDIGELIDRAKEMLPGIWEETEEIVTKKTDTIKKFVQEKMEWLLDLIGGKEPTDDPQNPAIPRILYFDVFYFGMPLSEAKLLGIGPTLGDPVADEVNGVQYWTVNYEGSKDTAILLFNGLEKNAPLTEIINIAVDSMGSVTVTAENAANAETIDAVYNSVTSWFSGEQAINLGDELLLPIYPGILDEGSTVSRVRMFLFADGKGYNAATHFVLTDENGAVNVVQYRYLDAAKLLALLTE